MKQNGPRLARSIPAKAGTSPITDRPIQKPCDSPFSGCQEAANKADHEREAGLDPLREGKPKLLRRSRDGAAHRRAGVVEKSVRPRRRGGSGEDTAAMALLISNTRRSACRYCSGRCRRDRREVGRPRLTVARLFVDRDDRFRADLEIRPAPYNSGLDRSDRLARCIFPRVSVKEHPTGAQAVGPKLNKLRPDRLSRFDHPRDSGPDIHELQPEVNRCCCC